MRPNVTFVDQERFGDQARQWNKRVENEAELLGHSDNVGGVDESIRGLASWLVGQAYFETQAYGDAGYHLEQVPLEGDLYREWRGAQGLLFRCHDVLGDWTQAQAPLPRPGRGYPYVLWRAHQTKPCSSSTIAGSRSNTFSPR